MTELSTQRLRLRRWRSDDLAALTEIFSEPAVWWFPLRRGFTPDETEAFLNRQLAAWDERGWGLWAVEQDGELAGYTGFGMPTFLPEVMPTPEIGWRLHPDFWGRGLATEAAAAALEFGFASLGLAEVVSIYQPDNVASGRVMQRIGMVFDRDTTDPKEGFPLRVYRLGAEQWRDQRGHA
jgi:RimJ/RimL family protein N-acetyltransferase